MAGKSNAGFWLVDTNPFGLPEPAVWWQRAVLAYDKMLRLMPSQTDRCYRLCRVARRDGQLGLNLVGDLHRHPDTTAMIQFGVVPELTLRPDAIYSNQIVSLLRYRDNWANFKSADDRANQIERAEADAAAALTREHHAQLDEVSTDSFRHVRYGYRAMTQAQIPDDAPTLLTPLPTLPAVLPRTLTTFAFGLQNR